MADTGVRVERAYRFIMPPGWVRIDLRSPVGPQVTQVVDQIVSQVPRGPRYSEIRASAVAQITRVAREAVENGVLDLVLPVKLIDGRLLSTSWAFLPLETPEGSDPLELLAAIASRDDSASLLDVGNLVALRIASRAQRSADLLQTAVARVAADLNEPLPEVAEADQAAVWTQRVQYFIGDPQRRDSWIIVVFSASDSGDSESAELTQALAALFDEVMLSVRFRND